jgi:hypothetical protein
MSGLLTRPEQDLVRAVWRALPGANRASVAARATRLLGRPVSQDTVRRYRPEELARSRTIREAGVSVPRSARPRRRPTLSYPSPLADLILESRAVRRRLGLGRKGGAD